MDEQKYSPMVEQYRKVKEQYPDAFVFYRIGDFYEMFFEDAVKASKELDLILTGKNAGVKDRIPMCGVPHHAVTGYVQRLVSRGYKVVIVEQMEDPKKAVGLVKRDVIRVVTPGTLIEGFSDDKASVYLAAIVDYGYGYAMALSEASTGENFILDSKHEDSTLLQVLLKNNVREVVVKEGFREKVLMQLRALRITISYCDREEIKNEYAALADKIEKPAERRAYGLMLNYMEATQKQTLSNLQPCYLQTDEEVLGMDYATMCNLELVKPLHESGKAITLWSFLDVCRSAMGSRLLKKWIERPLVKKEKILARQDKIAWLMKHFLARNKLKESLSEVYDLQRLITRIALNTASPVDCIRLERTLLQVPVVFDALKSDEFAEYTSLDPLKELAELLQKAFVEDPPAFLTDGGAIRAGYNADLDEARRLQKSGQDFIIAYENQERDRTGIKNLKIGYNKVFGYYIEISKGQLSQVKPEWGYIRKQTLTNNERFISPALKEKEDQILHANEHAIELEKELFREIVAGIREKLPQLQKLSTALAEIDCYYALAQDSSDYGYVRPTFSDDEMKVTAGRHPILDQMMKNPRYVANDIELSRDQNVLLITGPNMGGKSTYMRQCALLVIMAQIGCYVPAKSAVMPIFDKIFTRIGASDDILAGQSTFMVEMSEANAALQGASDRSLILFDEIGRGTSTYDGMALAQAMVEYIATCIHAKTLFSTHYHELTSLVDSVPGVRNVHVEVKADAQSVTFLYKVRNGSAGRSYGINVARLAGLPDSVLERAEGLQKELESRKHVVQQNYALVEMKKEDKVGEDLKKKLGEVDMDAMSPRDAWDMLADLQQEVKKNAG